MTHAEDYLESPFSLNTVHSWSQKCNLKLYYTRRKPYINSVQKHCGVLWAQARIRWTERKRTNVLWSDESIFYFLELFMLKMRQVMQVVIIRCVSITTSRKVKTIFLRFRESAMCGASWRGDNISNFWITEHSQL